jgi:hypothetical protein
MRKKYDLRDAQQRTVTALYEGVWYDPPFSGAQVVLPMGGGKTATALTAFVEMRDDGHADRLYVLAPKRVANLVWPAEPKLWEHLKDLRVVRVSGSAQQRLDALNSRADVYAIGVDNAQWFVDVWLAKKAPDWFRRTILCIDELSRFKNPRGKRLKALFPHINRFLACWGLTGTPRPNGYEDQFGPMKLVTAGKLWGRSFDRWRQANFYPTDYNQYNWDVMPEKAPAIVADINKASITIPLSEMPDLPPLNDGPEFIEWLDMPDDLIDRYKVMQRHLVSELKKKGKNVAAANMAVASGKLCQIMQGFLYAGSEDEMPVRGKQDYERFHDDKMERLHELIEEAGGEPVVVAYDFQADLDRLKEEFPGLPYFGISDAKDAEIEQQWNLGKLPIVGVHPASAGHGLNLQHGGSQLFWYGMTWSAELYDQLLKRFHRPGQVSAVWSRPILWRAPGVLYTTDEAKYDRVKGKMADQALFQRLLKEV